MTDGYTATDKAISNTITADINTTKGFCDENKVLEARYAPNDPNQRVYTNNGEIVTGIRNGVMEARAPILDSGELLCLKACDEAIQFLDYTTQRQARDGYEPVIFSKELQSLWPSYVFDKHSIGGVPVQLNPTAWMREIQYENDGYLKSYIKNGIIHGFDIVDSVETVPEYDSSNYPSVIHGAPNEYVQALIEKELQSGKYLLVRQKPKCIHALGAVEKSDSTYRPITDCSKPQGASVNNYMTNTHRTFVYNSVDDVSRMMRPGIYSATVDISAAYRAIAIKESHRQCQGLRWKIAGQQSYLIDTHMCFGARCAPYIFTQLGNFITRCMNRRGYHGILNYIDDFICFGDSFVHCQEVQMKLINLLIRLGFHISWTKCSSPSKVTKYLGLWFDSTTMQVSLPNDKMEKLEKELRYFHQKERATRHQLQKLCGILSHCARVVHGGRIFTRRMCSLLKGLKGNKRVRLNKGFKQDLQWWSDFAKTFNGTASIIKYNYGEGPWFATDASAQGYGVFSSGDWLAGYYNEPNHISPRIFDDIEPSHGHWMNVTLPLMQEKDNNINYWELIPVWLAVNRYARGCQGMHVVAFSDNLQVVYAINKGRSINDSSMNVLRMIFWECAKYNVYLSARYIPGELNIIPDLLSRISGAKYVSALMNFDLCCRCAESERN